MANILITVADFYVEISEELIKGASNHLEKVNFNYELVKLPGALEIPAAISFAIKSKKYDGFVALGCVIRGETSHYDYVCSESTGGLNQIAINQHAAIGNGILTVENKAQAWARAAVDKGNKGARAAEACVKMIELKRKFGI